MKKYLNILSLKNFLLINLMSIILCYRNNLGININNYYYKYNSWDLVFRIISSPKKIIVVWYLFFIIILFVNLFLEKSRYEEIYRYSSRKDYYVYRVSEIVMLSVFCNFIFFINICFSSLIKGRNFSGWGGGVVLLFNNADKYFNLIFMNGEIIKYNPMIQFLLYGVLLTIFFILIGILMEIINSIFNNKIIICLLALVLYFVISIQAYIYNVNSFGSKLMYNHLDINLYGFNLFANRYANMCLSIIYLIIFCIITYFIGMCTASKKEFY